MRQRLQRTGYWSPSKAKDFSGILGKKEGDLGKGDSKGVMFMAALIQTGKPKNRSKTPNKKLSHNNFFTAIIFWFINRYNVINWKYLMARLADLHKKLIAKLQK
jgi:hypothetical protein